MVKSGVIIGRKRPSEEDDIIRERRSKKSRDIPSVLKTEVLEEKPSISELSISNDAFTIRCSPGKVVNLVSSLTEDQKEAVRELGFGGVLSLKVTSVPNSFLPLILEAFSPVSYMFTASENSKFLLSKFDVRDMFLLPLTSTPVKLCPTSRSKGSSDVELKEYWRKQFNITDNRKSIPVVKAAERLNEIKEVTDEFKKLFVWYCMAVFFAPTSNYVLDFELVHAIEDVSEISNQDWCQYVFHSLCKATTRPLKAYLCGCQLFLMLTYFHRFEFRGTKLGHSLPLIQHWHKENLAERVKYELLATKLGDAPPSVIKFPRCLELIEDDEDSNLPLSNPLRTETLRTDTSLRSLVIDLPDNELTDEEIARMAVDPVQKSILSLKRDCSVFGTRCHMWMTDIKKNIILSSSKILETREAVKISEVSRPTLELSQSEILFSDPDFLKLLDSVDKYGMAIKEILDKIPPFQPYSKINEFIKEAVEDEVAIPDDVAEGDIGLDDLAEGRIEVEPIEKVYVRKDRTRREPQVLEKSDDVAKGDIGLDDLAEGRIEVEPLEKVYVRKDRTRREPQLLEKSDVKGPQFLEKLVVSEQACELVDDGGSFNILTEPTDESLVNNSDVCKLDLLVSNICTEEVVKHDLYAEKNEPAVRAPVEVQLGNDGGSINFVVEEDSVIQGLCTPVRLEDDCLNRIYMGEDNSRDLNVGTSYLLHSDSYAETMVVVPNHLGCTIDCGALSPTMPVVSATLVGHDDVAKQLLSLRKQIIDYSLLDDYELDNLKLLASYGSFNVIRKENIITLKPGEEIDTWIAECWSLNLNYLFSNMKDSSIPSRISFGLHYMKPLKELCSAPDQSNSDLVVQIYNVLDMFLSSNKKETNLNADMVFLPLAASGHFCCVCVNFKTRQLDYLDNRTYDFDITEMNYGLYARKIADVFGSYLCTKGYVKGAQVCTFKLVNIPFSWQLHFNRADKKDCGVYMFVHMLFYVGKLFCCGLGDQESRDLYRAEIGAIVLLSDLNEIREELIKNVLEFETLKGPLIPNLILERKNRDTNTRGKGITDGIDGSVCVVVNSGAIVDAEDLSTPSDNVLFSTPLTNTKTTTASPWSVIGSRMRRGKDGKGDGLGCSIYCGEEDDSLLVVSKFLRVNQGLFAQTLSVRKQVIDYCLLEDHDYDSDVDLVIIGGHLNLAREHMLTIHPTVPLSPNFIDLWSLLLNSLENKEQDSPSAFYFGLRHMDALYSLYSLELNESPLDSQMDRLVAEWDKFLEANKTQEPNLDVDLIFIPVKLDHHYFCVCINVKAQRIDILDHKLYKNFEDSDALRLAMVTVARMSDYLDTRDIKNNILNYDYVQIEFDFLSAEKRDFESGVFLMMNMACYEGEVYESKMRMKVSRRYYAAEMMASLVLADVNQYRSRVLVRVKKFISEKPLFWDSLKEKRKNNENVGKGQGAAENKGKRKVLVAAGEKRKNDENGPQPVRVLSPTEKKAISFTKFKILKGKEAQSKKKTEDEEAKARN